MNRFLSNLVAQATDIAPAVTPHTPSLFEPRAASPRSPNSPLADTSFDEIDEHVSLRASSRQVSPYQPPPPQPVTLTETQAARHRNSQQSQDGQQPFSVLGSHEKATVQPSMPGTRPPLVPATAADPSVTPQASQQPRKTSLPTDTDMASGDLSAAPHRSGTVSNADPLRPPLPARTANNTSSTGNTRVGWSAREEVRDTIRVMLQPPADMDDGSGIVAATLQPSATTVTAPMRDTSNAIAPMPDRARDRHTVSAPASMPTRNPAAVMPRTAPTDQLEQLMTDGVSSEMIVDIQIDIGRIDVRAAPATARSTQQDQAQQPRTMTLQQYTQRRNRNREW